MFFERLIPVCLFFLAQAYYAIMLAVIRVPVVEHYKAGELEQLLHILLPTYIYINVIGNMFKGIFTKTSCIKTSKQDQDHCCSYLFCEICQIPRPAGSWHCKRCNVCILRRDHHCTLFSCCIGLNNHRYYIVFMTYISIAMFYSMYFTYYFVELQFEQEGMILRVYRLINPFLRHLINEPWSFNDVYIAFFFFITGVLIWSLAFLFFHMQNVLMGTTSYHSKKWDFNYVKTNWRQNVEMVFGKRWHVVFFWPYIDSPLPEIEEHYHSQ